MGRNQRPAPRQGSSSGNNKPTVAILGAGIAGALIADELARTDLFSIVLVRGNLTGSTDLNQRWLHSGLLFRSPALAESLWRSNLGLRHSCPRASQGPPHAKFIIRDKAAADGLAQRWSDWGVSNWALRYNRDPLGFLTPDRVFDYSLAAREAVTRASSCGAAVLHGVCARSIDVDDPHQVTVALSNGERIVVDHCVVATGARSKGLVRAAGIDMPTVIRRCTVVRFERELVPCLTVWLDARDSTHHSPDLSLTPFRGSTIAAEPDGDEVDTPDVSDNLNRRSAALISEYAELNSKIGSAGVIARNYCYKLEHRKGATRVNLGVLSSTTVPDWPKRLTVAFPGKATLAPTLASAIVRNLVELTGLSDGE